MTSFVVEERKESDILSFLARIEASVTKDNHDTTVYSSAFEDESNYLENKSVNSANSINTSNDTGYDERKKALLAKIGENTLKYCLSLINNNAFDNEFNSKKAIKTRQQRLLSFKSSDNDSSDDKTVNTMVTEVISERDSPLDYDSALKFLFERSTNTAFLIQAPETRSVVSGSRPSSAISRDSQSVMTVGSDFSSQDLSTEAGRKRILGTKQQDQNNNTQQSPSQFGTQLLGNTLNLQDTNDTNSIPSTARSNISDLTSISDSDTGTGSEGSTQPVLFNSLMSIGQPDTTLIRGVAVKFADGEYRLFPKTADRGSKRVTFKKREDITDSKHCYSYKPRSEDAEYAKYFLKYFFSKHYERLQKVLTNEDFVHYTSEVIKDIHEGLPLTLNDVNVTLYSYLCFFIKYNWTDDITRYDLVMMMIYFQVKSFFYNGEIKTTAGQEIDVNELQKSPLGITQWECKSKNCWEKAIIDIASILNSSPDFEKDGLIHNITYVIKKNCPHVKEDRYLSRLVSTILSTYFFYYVNDGQEYVNDGQEPPRNDSGENVATGATVKISALTRSTGQTALSGLTGQTSQSGLTQLTETSMSGQLMRAATKMVENRNRRNPVSMDQDPFGILDDLSVQTFATPQYYTRGEDKDIDYLLKLLQGKTDINEAEVKINFELIRSRMNIRTFKALKLLSTGDLLRTDVIHYILDKGGDRIEDSEKTILKSFFNDIVKDDVAGVPNGSKYDRLLYPQLLRKLKNAIDDKLKNAIDDGRLELDEYKTIFKNYWMKYQVNIFGTKYLTLTALEEKRFLEKKNGNTTMDETLKKVATNEEIFYMMYDYIYYNCPKNLKEDKVFLKDFFAGEIKKGETSQQYWTTPDGYPPSNINDEFPALTKFSALTNYTTVKDSESIIDYYIDQGFFGDKNINLYKIPTEDRNKIVEDIVNNIDSFTYGKEVQEHWNKLYKFVKFKSTAAESAQGLLTSNGAISTTSVGGNINKSKAFFSTRKDYRPFPKKIPTKNKKRVTFKSHINVN